MNDVVRSSIAILAIAAAAAGSPRALAAQTGDAPPICPSPQCIEIPSWVGQFTILSGNAVLGGLTAGVLQRARGGSFRDGFTRGFFGGATVYAGKRLSVEDFDGAGLLGRQVAAVGSSVVRNASDGRPSLERLMFAAGPLRVHVDRREGWHFRPTLDATATVTALYALAEPELKLDAGASLSAGAPVFRVEEKLLVGVFGDQEAAGLELGFNMFLSQIERFGPEYHRRVFAHERVHVLQGDFFFLAWSDPIIGHLAERIPGGARVRPYVDVDLGDLMIGILEVTAFRAYERRPWELEAEWLGRRF